MRNSTTFLERMTDFSQTKLWSHSNKINFSDGTAISTQDIMNLLELGLETYLQFDGTVHKQMRGTPMGSPRSCLLADETLKNLETRVFETNG